MRLPSKRARRGFERSERAHRGIARGERVLKYGRVRRLSAYGSRHMHLFEGTRACYCLREPPRFLIIGLESVHNNRHSPHNFEDLLGFSTSVPKQCERAARGGDGGQSATTPRRGIWQDTHRFDPPNRQAGLPRARDQPPRTESHCHSPRALDARQR